MTEQQIRWAVSHDWFIQADWLDSETQCVTVLDRWTIDGQPRSEVRTFTDFAELRHWAGY